MAKLQVTRVSAYGLVIDNDNLLLCRLSDHLPHAGMWTLPTVHHACRHLPKNPQSTFNHLSKAHRICLVSQLPNHWFGRVEAGKCIATLTSYSTRGSVPLAKSLDRFATMAIDGKAAIQAVPHTPGDTDFPKNMILYPQ